MPCKRNLLIVTRLVVIFNFIKKKKSYALTSESLLSIQPYSLVAKKSAIRDKNDTQSAKKLHARKGSIKKKLKVKGP